MYKKIQKILRRYTPCVVLKIIIDLAFWAKDI